MNNYFKCDYCDKNLDTLPIYYFDNCICEECYEEALKQEEKNADKEYDYNHR